MRIVIVSETAEPSLNGVAVAVGKIFDDLEHRHEIYILTAGVRNYIEKNPTHISRFPSCTWFGPNDYPIVLPGSTSSIREKLQEIKPDVIHFQHSLGFLSNPVMDYAIENNIPMVVTYHTLLKSYAFPGAKWFAVHASTKFCNRCDQVVAPSNPMKEILLGYGVTKPITVIPTGINPEDYAHPFTREELLAKWGVPKDKHLLLYLSRVAKEKNLELLFAAIERLQRKRNDFHLLLAGGGPELKKYQKLAKKMGIDGVIAFTGKLPKEVANRVFGAAYIFTFPSITETQGIVIAEAMIAGVPAIAPDVMGQKDIIVNDENGYLTHQTVEDFTAKIELLLDNKDLRNKLAEQAKISAHKFEQTVTCAKMEKTYEQTIRDHHGS